MLTDQLAGPSTDPAEATSRPWLPMEGEDDKMALTSPSLPCDDTHDASQLCFSPEPLTQEDEGGKGTSLLDYKRLAIEVARQIAPDLQETLEHTLQASLGKIQAELTNHSSRIEELKQRVLHLEKYNDALQAKLKNTAGKTEVLEELPEDLENLSRRNNLRVVGLPESVQHGNLHALCGANLSQVLGLNHKCRVERARRIGPVPAGVTSDSHYSHAADKSS